MSQPTPVKPNNRGVRTLQCNDNDITAPSPCLENCAGLRPWTPPMLVILDTTNISSGLPTFIVEGSSGGVAS